VTMPIHPLCGETLEVIRWVRFPDGRRYVDVQHPHDGRVIRLPLAFTDRAPSLVAPSDGKKTTLFSAGGLQRLAAAIEAAKGRHQEGRKVDIGEEMSSRENTEQVIRNAKDTSPQPLSRQSASAGTSCRASRSAGRAGPSDAAQGEEDRGGGEP
jgi:hypothetical protein